MVEAQAQTRPPVVLIKDMKESLLADIRAKGLWRCGVIGAINKKGQAVEPACSAEPYAQVAYMPDHPRTRGLFCFYHTAEYCAKLGFKMLVEP